MNKSNKQEANQMRIIISGRTTKAGSEITRVMFI